MTFLKSYHTLFLLVIPKFCNFNFNLNKHSKVMKENLNTLLKEIKTLFPYLTEKYSVQSIEVFGSYVRNEQNENSDLDLLVTFSQVPGLIKFISLKNFLSDTLGVNVDLVMKNSLKPGISGFILNEAVPV